MKRSINFINLLYNAIICLLAFMVVTVATGSIAAGVVAGCVMFTIGFIPRKTDSYGFHNEILKTIFSSEIQKQLYPDTSFYQGAATDSASIDAIKIQIPQAGTGPSVKKNPEQRPIPLELNKDDVLEYDVDLYETSPSLVTDVNQLLVTYDKRAVVLESHASVLEQRIADDIAIKWLPANEVVSTNVISSTGTGNTGTVIPGMTGTRKELVENDFIKLSTLLDRQNIPNDGQRKVLIYTEQLEEVRKIAAFKDFDKTGIQGFYLTGAIGKIYNMNVFVRNTPLLVNTSGQKKAYGSAVAATDKLAILAWHPRFVRYAKGFSKVYMDSEVRPGMGGITMSAAVRSGATPSRKDYKGVAALIQG